MPNMSHQAESSDEMTLVQLLSLWQHPLSRRIKCLLLKAHLRSLHGLADYFEWQAANARAGLADTHKRMAVAKSDLNVLMRVKKA